jgi:hypothetical protein
MVAEATAKGIVLRGNDGGQTAVMDGSVPGFDLAFLRDLREPYASLAVELSIGQKHPKDARVQE